MSKFRRIAFFQAFLILILGGPEVLAQEADTVSVKIAEKGVVVNTVETLNGQSAGVSVVKGDSETMMNAVRVRGTTSLTGGNDPLVIIDGMQSDLAALNMLYPADIESFTILKNAGETSKYGSQGASGVIKVNTYQGSKAPFNFRYSSNYGLEHAYKYLEMMNASEYLEAYPYHDVINKGYDTNFQKEITRNGFVHNHHFAFGGGTDQSFYRVSLGVQQHDYIIKSTGRDSYMAKVDLTQKAFKDAITLKFGLVGSLVRRDYSSNEKRLLYSAAAFNPTFPATRINGSWPGLTTSPQISNPMAILNQMADEDAALFSAHAGISYQVNKSLAIEGFVSHSYGVTDVARYAANAYRQESKTQNTYGNLTANYNRSFGKHSIGISALAEAQKFLKDGFYTTVSGIKIAEYAYYNLQAGSTIAWGGTGSSYEDAKQLSFLLSANYDYAKRYSLRVNLRSDASSKFGANHKWGLFPSISGSWVISNEEFAKDIRWLSSLKLNVGYGKSGSQGGLSSYNSLRLVEPTGIVEVNGTPTVIVGVVRNANPDLKWEVKSTFNAGLRATMFQNRLSVLAEYYYSKTTDMLYNYTVPVPKYEYNTLLANIGSMMNSGYEFAIGGIPVLKRDISLNINLRMAFTRNKLLSLSGWYGDDYLTAPDIVPLASLSGAGYVSGDNAVTYQIVGQPIGVFYLPHCTGLGDYEDGSGFKYYEFADGDDRYVAGQAMPKATMGANFSFRYRNFDISVQMNGAFGHKIYNGTALSYMNYGSLPNYNIFKKAKEQMIYDSTISDYWLEKGDYVNIDYLTLGYNVPVAKMKFIKSLRVSTSINNVATITGYSGLTPMINSTAVGSTLGVDDLACYPVYRIFSVGLSVLF